MGKRYVFTWQARADLFEIADYLSERNPRVALAFVTEVERVCDLLSDMPGIGRLVDFIRSADILMIPAGKYDSHLIFYTVHENVPTIVRILHGRRDIEALLDQWMPEE